MNRELKRVTIVVLLMFLTLFVSSTIIRMSVSRSCEAARRPAIPRTVSRRSASSASGRGSASRPGPIDRRSTISG